MVEVFFMIFLGIYWILMVIIGLPIKTEYIYVDYKRKKVLAKKYFDSQIYQ